jgi:P pilus assembly chaperone PapD
MKKNALISYRLLVCLMLYGSFFTLAYGQDFEVAPAKLNFTCEPGQIETKSITIHNHGNEKQQFTVSPANMKFDSLSAEEIAKKSCKDWLTLTPSFFTINPNDKMEVKVIMQVPPNESSTKGALIIVSATEEQNSIAADKQMKSAIKVRPRISVKVTQSPKSNTNYKASVSNLKEITLSKDSIRSFQVKITNQGDKMIDGKIYLVLSNLETAKETKEKPQSVSIFPSVSKTSVLKLPKNTPSGKYSLAVILDYGNSSALEAVQMNIVVK